MSPAEWTLLLTGAVVAGFVQGLSGFAFSMVSMSIWVWNAQLGLCIAGVAAAQFAVPELAMAREEAAVEVLDGLAFEFVLQTERSELAHGVRQQRDADAQRLDLAHTFEHGAADAALVQRERESEAGDAAADGGDV